MKKGFTLVELGIVTAVIAILAAIIVPNIFRSIEKAKIAKLTANIKAIDQAVNALFADTSRWPLPADVGANEHLPLSKSALMSNSKNWVGWSGPYLEGISDYHPWRGHYFLDAFLNLGEASNYDYEIHICECCSDNPDNHTCRMPESVVQRIDEMIDDGNPAEGTFQKSYTGEGEWVIQWDTCEGIGCCDDYEVSCSGYGWQK